MKNKTKHFLLLVLTLSLFTSCGTDDGTATPASGSTSSSDSAFTPLTANCGEESCI